MRNWIIATVVAGATVGAGAQAGAQNRIPPPPPAIAGIVLPQGKLGTGFVNRTISADFVVMDGQIRQGNMVEATRLTLYVRPHSVYGRLAVYVVTRLKIDCAAGTREELGTQAFDEQGDMVIWLPAAPEKVANVRNSTAGLFALNLCAKVEPDRVVTGAAEALALARSQPDFGPDGGKFPADE